MASDQTKEASTAMEFKHFDIVSDLSDHYYRYSNLSEKDTHCFTNVNSSVHKKIMKEWKMLANDLPDSIYVRVYETRIDLLRAVIIGASGTPYHDGLFFFDIAFPTDYPTHPPQVYYHAHGLRLNPNLYACGKVCLSLINTWTGSKSEIWMPTTSTILQLLVSIQGLVLNDKPYFNEPNILGGRNKMSESKLKKSTAYSKDVFVLSCKTMLYTLKKPPKNFESFVAEHFCSRGENILEAIEAYSNGSCIVGEYVGESSSSLTPALASSQFEVNAAEFYSDLSKAYDKMVTPAPEPQNLTPSKGVAEASTTSKPQAIAKKPKHGTWKKITSAFKCIF